MSGNNTNELNDWTLIYIRDNNPGTAGMCRYGVVFTMPNDYKIVKYDSGGWDYIDDIEIIDKVEMEPMILKRILNISGIESIYKRYKAVTPQDMDTYMEGDIQSFLSGLSDDMLNVMKEFIRICETYHKHKQASPKIK